VDMRNSYIPANWNDMWSIADMPVSGEANIENDGTLKPIF